MYYKKLLHMKSIPENENALTRLQSENEIILYQPDETLRLDVRVEDETVWLSNNRLLIYSERKDRQ